MQRSSDPRKLISSVAILLLLLFLTVRTSSQTFIFLPFLLCSMANVGKNVALLLGQKSVAVLCHRIFLGSFFLFWFGFLLLAGYVTLRDRNYQMFLFTLPFWLAGIFFAIKTFSKIN